MQFQSILFRDPDEVATAQLDEAPGFFRDLNLDQVVEAMTKDFEEYDLAPFFYLPLRNIASITYRQEVMEDLENEALMQAIHAFSEQMKEMRKCLARSKELHDYQYVFERWFLSATDIYVTAVGRILGALGADHVQSQGLLAFREYLKAYAGSEAFRQTAAAIESLNSHLSSIRYCLNLKSGGITVSRFDEEGDYGSAIEKTFRKFSSLPASERRTPARNSVEVNHVQSRVLDRLALLYPDIFRGLDEFYARHQDFLDSAVARFDREIQFYIAYLSYIGRLRQARISFCRPQLVATVKDVGCRASVDIALASKLAGQGREVIPNDFFLRDPERILVVTGPNQGGKTTFARMFGQVHYLASLGCPVPGTEARLFVFDRIFSHFERREDITNLRGKLQDDLVRIRRIVDEATSRSLIVMNEVFSSTTFGDAVYLSKMVIGRISELDAVCVWVTFLDELASFNEKTVSMVAVIDPDNPTVRTYKIQRKPADGLAYALALAQKYRVTYDSLRKRVRA